MWTPITILESGLFKSLIRSDLLNLTDFKTKNIRLLQKFGTKVVIIISKKHFVDFSYFIKLFGHFYIVMFMLNIKTDQHPI